MTKPIFIKKPCKGITRRKVQGVGTNDADYVTMYQKDGGEHICPYYKRWRGMLTRCYAVKSLNKKPCYENCTIHKDWLLFSNFRNWMERQDWEGKDLDKDLLVKGNTVYGPDTCVFINPATNKAISISRSRKLSNKYLAGVTKTKAGKFATRVRAGSPSKNRYLGTYCTEEEAHNMWRIHKAENFRRLSELESDMKVKTILHKLARDLDVLLPIPV